MARKNLLKGFKKPKGISFEPIDSKNLKVFHLNRLTVPIRIIRSFMPTRLKQVLVQQLETL